MNLMPFCAEGSDGKMYSMVSFLGKVTVLFFYLKDGGFFCNREIKNFKKNYFFFERNKIQVFGINLDSIESHISLIRKFQGLPFVLLKDSYFNLGNQFGVYRRESLFSKKCSILRSTFILNKMGKVVYTFNKVSSVSHVDEVQRAITHLDLI